MTQEKMYEYGKFSVQYEMINNLKLPQREINNHLKQARESLKYWENIMKHKASGVDPEELENNLLNKIENFSFN